MHYFSDPQYAWTIHEPLPKLPIPLSRPAPDVQIDLGAVFATAYRRGRYDRRLNYKDPPPGPLSEADRAWAMERARAAAR